MKRKIKFRAWDRINNKLWDCDFIHFGIGGIRFAGLMNDKPCVVELVDGDFEIMQFTGLLDKNKKDIYESDILESKSWGVGRRQVNPYHVVGWRGCGWVANGYNGEIKVSPNLDVKNDFDIIGNIYEDPELLKPTK